MDEGDILATLDELLKLPNECEWVEFKTAANSFDSDELGEYFSALSNEANLHGATWAWLVMRVDKKHNVVGTNYRRNPGSIESLKHEISRHTALNETFRGVHAAKHVNGRVLLFQIPPAPHGVPMSWKGHFYGRDGESKVALKPAEYDEIKGQTKAIRAR